MSSCTPSRHSNDHIVNVAPPTLDPERDQASVQSAFDAVQPGGTVQFARGTYMLGPGARLTMPDVTVLGHSKGTILRGCEPEAFDVEMNEVVQVVFGCTGLAIEADRQTIRNLTFEYVWHGIVIGPFPRNAEEGAATQGMLPEDRMFSTGGHLIEENTFRAVPNGLRTLGTGDDIAVVRNNEFIDVYHAIGMYGSPIHFLENTIVLEQPERVPVTGHPGSAVLTSAQNTDCSGHLIKGNQIVGYPGAIYVIGDPGTICQNVTIENNLIKAGRVAVPPKQTEFRGDANTMVGLPIYLIKSPSPDDASGDDAPRIENIRVMDNTIIGSEGIGIFVDGSNNEISGNSISDIRVREPFDSPTWWGGTPPWEQANGSGIWIAPNASGNKVQRNTFENIANYHVYIEGDDNVVEVFDLDTGAKDVGERNSVMSDGR